MITVRQSKLAKIHYDDYTNNHPTIHSNRFPSWEEMSAVGKEEYFQRNEKEIMAAAVKYPEVPLPNPAKIKGAPVVHLKREKHVLEPVMYFVVRRDLNMPVGKVAVQVAHAAVRLYETIDHRELLEDWQDKGKGFEAKIVLGCTSLDELLAIAELARENFWNVSLVEDAGLTVFEKPTITCIGLGPLTREQGKKLKHLKLF